MNYHKKCISEKLKSIDEILLFLLFLAGFVIILTIPMICTGNILRHGMVQAITPAMSAMLVLKIKNKDYPKKIFDTFLFFGGIAILLVIIDGFDYLDTLNITQVGLLLLWLIVLILIISEKKEVLIKYNLNGGNLKKVIISLLLYIAFIHIEIMIMLIPTGKSKDLSLFLSTYNIMDYINMFIYLSLFQSVYLFGEEYGWRAFLQSRLQDKFGKKIGVLILGPIWGLWHINLWFFRNVTPALLITIIISYIVNCAFSSVIYAYIYEKTNTFWSAVLIHIASNAMGFGILKIGDNFKTAQSDFSILTNNGNSKQLIHLAFMILVATLLFMTKTFKKENY